jgi:hypothetical protein
LPRSACCEEAIPRDYRDDRVKGVLLVVSGRDQSGADAGVKADLLVEVTIYSTQAKNEHTARFVTPGPSLL